MAISAGAADGNQARSALSRAEGGLMNSDEMGPRLREARLKTNQSLRSVATAVGVSPSLLSQVETGKTHPSVSTLYALVNELGISIDELLGTGARSSPTADAPEPGAVPTRTVVQRAADNPVLVMENGVTWERLAAAAGGEADCMLVTYEPGAASSVEGRLMRHYGSEHAYLLEGELTLQVEFDVYKIGAGDSIFFDSQQPHLYVNNTDKPVRGLWFLLGRRQLNDTPPVLPVVQRGSGRPRNAVDVLQAWDGHHAGDADADADKS